MASMVPCKKNTAGYIFYVGLVSQANGNLLQVNPTLAAGDVKIAIDDGAPANLATLPAVDADFTKRVKVVLSQAETNGDNLSIIFSDAAGAEWCDQIINIQTVANQIDDIAAYLGTAISEMAQGIPPATPTLIQAVMYLYMAWRNETTRTSTTWSVKNDAGTVIAKATISDDETTFTKGEFVSGP